jgi:tetratricopeptide (TPR) repeat protein
MLASLKAWCHRQLAIGATLLGRHEIALDHWRAVRCSRPADARPLAAIAHLLAGAGRRDEAIAALQASLAVDAAQAAGWFNLGFLQQAQGEHHAALASFDRALALDQSLDRAWYGKALSLIRLERVPEAIPLLRRNTELQPMSPFGWYQLAHAYVRSGEPEKARGVIRRLAGFEPQVARQLERETGLGPMG